MTAPVNKTAITPPTPDFEAHSPNECCLMKLKNKVCDAIQSRWTLITATAVAIGSVMGAISGATVGTAAGIGVFAAGTLANWYFTPIREEALTCVTLNTLGVFSDFVEFLGDYGPTLNPIKERLEACVLGQVAGKQSGEEGKPVASEEDIIADCNRGGTFEEVLPPDLLRQVIEIATKNGISADEFTPLTDLLDAHRNERSFHALQNCSPDALTGVDNDYRKKAKADSVEFDLPTLNSPAPIVGNTHAERVLNLARSLFTTNRMSSISPVENVGDKDGIRAKFEKEQRKFKTEYRTNTGVIPLEQIRAFTQSKVTAATYHFLYECSRLYEVGQDKRPVEIEIETGNGRRETGRFNNLFEAFNYGKQLFKQGLGSPQGRAEIFCRHLQKTMPDVIFLQEAESYISEAIDKLGYFSTAKVTDADGKTVRRSKDGSEIHLKTTSFQPEVEVLPYNGDDIDQKSTLLKATQTKNGVSTVLGSIHGDAKDLERTKTLCQRAIDVFTRARSSDPRTQFYVGIDANPTNAAQIASIQEFLGSKGFKFTDYGINMVRTRGISTQVRKRRDFVESLKDGFIVPSGYEVTEPTIAFEPPPFNRNRRLPDYQNPSDHGAVGARIQPVMVKA